MTMLDSPAGVPSAGPFAGPWRSFEGSVCSDRDLDGIRRYPSSPIRCKRRPLRDDRPERCFASCLVCSVVVPRTAVWSCRCRREGRRSGSSPLATVAPWAVASLSQAGEKDPGRQRRDGVCTHVTAKEQRAVSPVGASL